jgi:hypothetical protein
MYAKEKLRVESEIGREKELSVFFKQSHIDFLPRVTVFRCKNHVEFNKYQERCCNSQKPIQRTNMRGLMAARFRAFRWILFLI